LLVHLRAAGDIAPLGLGVEFLLRLVVTVCRALALALAPAPFRGVAIGFAAPLLRLRVAQVFGVLLRALVFRSTRLVQRNRDRLLGVFDLALAGGGFQLAVLEFVHDP